MAKVYSPSQTATWMRCPMIRALQREGWMPRHAQKKDWAAIIGKSFAAGVGVYNNLRMDAEKMGHDYQPAIRADVAEACVATALQIMAGELEAVEKLGLTVDPSDEQGYLSLMESRVRKAVTAYVLSDPIPSKWRIVAVEEPIGEENCRPDLIVRNEFGLAVVDYKTKVILASQYRQKTINEYANSHQMLHYGWRAEEKYGETLSQYYIGLAVFEPRWAFDLIPFPYHPETLKIWAGGAKAAWLAMEREDLGEVPPWLSNRHSDNFGQCPFYAACFRHHYDPALMITDYIQVEKDVNETTETRTL